MLLALSFIPTMTFPRPNAGAATLDANKKFRILKAPHRSADGGDTERLVFDEESSLFAEEGPQDSNNSQAPTYCRLSSTSRRKLEQDLLQLYNATGEGVASVFPSGMAAIMTTLTALTRRTKPYNKHQVIVYGSELYFEAPQTIQYLEEEGRVDETIAVDIKDTQALLQLFRSEQASSIRVFYYESASNPSGQMLDPDVVPQLKRLAPHCTFVCDNTWLTGVAFNPLQHGADICIESMTKYLSGGTCIGGCAIGRTAEVMEPVLNHLRFMGLFVDSDRCTGFSQQLVGVSHRVTRTSKVALAVAQWLEQDDRVRHIDYPLLPSHASHAVAKKWLTLGPGSMWLQLSVTQDQLFQVVCGPESPIEFKTSFGGPFSRLDSWPNAGDDENDHDGRNKDGKKYCWLRLSMGFDEETDETIEKVKNLLDRLDEL